MTKAGWAGLTLSALVGLFLTYDGYTGWVPPPALVVEIRATGWPLWTGPLTGTIALISAVVYLIPRTAVLGVVLITGFLGGAIATHVRLGELGSPPELVSLAVGIAAWAGLWLRDPRVRALLPLA